MDEPSIANVPEQELTVRRPKLERQPPAVPPTPRREGPLETSFEVRFVDEIGLGIAGLDVEIEAGERVEQLKTNAAGVASLEGTTAGSGKASVLDFEALEKILAPRWAKVRIGRLAQLLLERELAAAHELPEDLCHGDVACEQNELSLRVNTANLQEGVFAFCLQQCWASKKAGRCRSDFDCVPSGPCSAPTCDDGTCSQDTKEDGTRCTRPTGEVGACTSNQCASPSEYLARCGGVTALAVQRTWRDTATVAQRCRSGGWGDASVRRGITNPPLLLTSDLLKCVDAALELGADPKGEYGKR